MANKDIVSEYANSDLEERVEILFRHYANFERLVQGCEKCLNIYIREERDYKWQSARTELGVRVQTSKISDPTAKTAISNVTIENAIREADLSELEKEIDEEVRQEHEEEVKIIKDMKEDIVIFRDMFCYLNPISAERFEKYLNCGRRTEVLAQELNISQEAIKVRMSECKKTVFEQTIIALQRKYQFRGGKQNVVQKSKKSKA